MVDFRLSLPLKHLWHCIYIKDGYVDAELCKKTIDQYYAKTAIYRAFLAL